VERFATIPVYECFLSSPKYKSKAAFKQTQALPKKKGDD
jgi:hypothetical protein